MHTIFLSIFNFFSRRRKLFFAIVIPGIILLVYLAAQIRLEEDIFKIIPHSREIEKYNRLLQGSRFTNKIIVNISLADTSGKNDKDLLISYAGMFTDSLKKGYYPSHISKIEDRFDNDNFRLIFNEIYENLPLYLNEEDYHKIDSLIIPWNIQKTIAANYKTLVSPAGFIMKDVLLRDPLGFTFLALQKLNNFRFDENFIIEDGYIFSSDKKNLIIFLTPAYGSTETNVNGELMDGMDNISGSLSMAFDQTVKLEYFGTAAVSVSNARQIKQDIILTISIAVILMITFISLFFRKKAIFFLIFFPAFTGASLALAILFLFQTNISAISLGFGAVLLGITIDYSLHFFTHLKNRNDIGLVIRDISTPVLISSLTTAAAFFCLLIIDSAAIRDLGLFAGISILGAALATLIILPQLAPRKKVPAHPSSGFLHRIAAYPYHQNKILGILIILLTIIFLFTWKKVQFEGDMSNLSFVNQKLKHSEENLDKISGYKLRTIFVASTGENLDEALRKQERVEGEMKDMSNRGIVERYASISALLPSDSMKHIRIARWKAFWTPDKIKRLEQDLIMAGGQYKFKTSAFDPLMKLLRKNTESFLNSQADVVKKLFLENYIQQNGDSTTVITLLRVAQDKKELVYHELGSSNNVVIFDKQLLTTVFIDTLKKNFDLLILVSMLVVFMILTVSFGRIELGIVTFIPMLISWIWTLGIMSLLGIKFNIFNIVISTFIFGLGIDYSIFIMRGLLQEYKTGIDNLISYKTSILISAITTLIGIGVLVFAKHPALKSIALAAVIGITSVIFITYTLEPVLFRWLIYHKKKRRKFPVTFMDFVFSICTVLVYLSGGIILIISGFVLRFLLPFINIEKRKMTFHSLLSYASTLIVFGIFHNPKKIINWERKRFKKPAVIIANHQSQIDLVLIIMLYPKMILMTNEWVIKNPILGRIVRLADYFDGSAGLETLLPELEGRVKQGYSVMIFPEGSRSADMKIKRFHKGAFYLAEKLNLDILPVIVHGTGKCVTKGEPFLKKTKQITVKILDRIEYDDPAFGKTQLEKARIVRKHMIGEYDQIKAEIEDADFYKYDLIHNYIYKGPVLEWYIRIKLRLENGYVLFDKCLPEKGKIVDIGCGYGAMAYMLNLLSPERNMTGVDYDGEKIAVAENAGLKNNNTNFVCMDVLSFDFQNSDAFIMSDILHYMPDKDQEKLVSKCASKLNSGGVILVRDADRAQEKRHKRTRMTEFFSTRMGFNKTRENSKELFFTSKAKIEEMLSRNGLKTEVIEEKRHTSNFLILARKED